MKFRIQYNRLSRTGIPGTCNLKNNKNDTIWYPSIHQCEQRIDELNAHYVKNGLYRMFGIKEYEIIPLRNK